MVSMMNIILLNSATANGTTATVNGGTTATVNGDNGRGEFCPRQQHHKTQYQQSKNVL